MKRKRADNNDDSSDELEDIVKEVKRRCLAPQKKTWKRPEPFVTLPSSSDSESATEDSSGETANRSAHGSGKMLKLSKIINAMDADERHELEQRIASKLQTIEDGGHWVFATSGKTKFPKVLVNGSQYSAVHVIWLLKDNPPLDRSTHHLWRGCELDTCVRSEHHLALTYPKKDNPFANINEADIEHGIMMLMRKQVEREDGHLDWNGPVSKLTEYGVITWRGRQWKAHQLSYALNVLRGPLPAGMVVAHGTGCPRTCSNAEHLRIATHLENQMDRRTDETISPTGMTMELAEKIRASRGESTARERAARFNTTKSLVQQIDDGTCWLTPEMMQKRQEKRAQITMDDYRDALTRLMDKATTVPLTAEDMASEAFKNGSLKGPHLIPHLAPKPSGYCIVCFNDTYMPVHRLAAIVAAGSIPPHGTVARHLCERKDCFAHVRLGSHRENAQDRVLEHGGKKLTSDDVRKIREARSENRFVVAARFDVHWSTICNIWRGKTYGYVT